MSSQPSVPNGLLSRTTDFRRNAIARAADELPSAPSPHITGYCCQVECWVRFFTVRNDAALAQRATEDPSIHLTTQPLDELKRWLGRVLMVRSLDDVSTR